MNMFIDLYLRKYFSYIIMIRFRRGGKTRYEIGEFYVDDRTT